LLLAAKAACSSVKLVPPRSERVSSSLGFEFEYGFNFGLKQFLDSLFSSVAAS